MGVNVYKSVTDKYSNMIQAFESDFSLAKENDVPFNLKEIQKLIDNEDERILNDIKLLEELSFKIRHNQIEIVEVKEGNN